MAILLSDNGAFQTYLGDDGQTYEVASQFAPPSLGVDQLAPPAAMPQVPAIQMPQAPTPEPIVAPAPVAPQPAPDLAPPAPAAPELAAPPVEEEMQFEPEVIERSPPQILPENPRQTLDTPTEVAAAVGAANQDRAASIRNVAEAGLAAGDEINNAFSDADYQAQEYQKQRQAEVQLREKDEAELTEKHKKLVDRYANFKVDPNRGMSTERQTMAWIGAAIAGIGQVIAGKDPSQNPVIPLIFAQMDRRVQLQLAERDALGNSIGISKDGIADFRGATKTRLGEYDLRRAAAYEQAAKKAEGIKARLGSIQEKEAADQVIAAMRAEQAVSFGGAVKAEADERLRARQAAAAARASQARAQAAALEAARKEEVDLAKQGLRRNAQGTIVRADDLADPKDALAIQGAQLDNERKRRELTGEGPIEPREQLAREKDNAARALNGFDGKPLFRTVVKQGPDGKEVKEKVRVMASDDVEARYLKTAGAAVDKLARAADYIKLLRANNGGSIKALGSEESQKLTALVKDIDLNNLVARNMGVPTGKDMEIVEGLRGGVDIAAFIRDPTVGIEAMSERAVENYNADLRQKSDYFDNADAAPLKPARSAAAKVSEMRIDERVDAITKGDPSIAGDPSAVASDREFRLQAVDTLLARTKPSRAELDKIIRATSASTTLEPATKALIIARLTEAKDSDKAKLGDEADKLKRSLPGGEVPLFEGMRLGLEGQ